MRIGSRIAPATTPPAQYQHHAIAAGAATTLGGWTADGLAALIKFDVETADLASMSGRVLGYTAIGTFLLCMAAVTVGGSLALRLQPAQALRSL